GCHVPPLYFAHASASANPLVPGASRRAPGRTRRLEERPGSYPAPRGTPRAPAWPASCHPVAVPPPLAIQARLDWATRPAHQAGELLLARFRTDVAADRKAR